MEAENMVHSDSMSPASLGICEKLFRRWELKTSLTEGSARRSQQTLTIRLGLPAQKSNNRTPLEVQIGEARRSSRSRPSRYHCCPAHVSVEVPRVEQWSPQSEHYQVPLPGTPRRPGTLYCCSARRHKQQQETYPQPEGKLQGSDPLVHRGELQHMAAELGSYKQAHTSSPPLTLGNSRVVEGPAPLKELGFQSPSYAWR
ncbi:hypothetical protein L3Q82_009709 [Scortum barcoo]|uniref:Uncharacterized protein n=1 Tax=Scortum barcoo TaxID=214431 RepID=A0ACB8WGZ5_9TELE|nr:hypothetical protein L3Q82_009709 [Scortum barcoo]